MPHGNHPARIGDRSTALGLLQGWGPIKIGYRHQPNHFTWRQGLIHARGNDGAGHYLAHVAQQRVDELLVALTRNPKGCHQVDWEILGRRRRHRTHGLAIGWSIYVVGLWCAPLQCLLELSEEIFLNLCHRCSEFLFDGILLARQVANDKPNLACLLFL